METNIILAGVGGQGIVSISFVIDMAALKKGLHFKQAEVHGMSQRGGAVSSHLRLSDKPIHSDLVPRGKGTLVLAVEPLESLRYVEYLSPQGALVAGTDPFINIADYGEVEPILDAVAAVPSHTLIPAERLARQAGTAKAQNMVMLGAASPYLDLPDDLLESSIREAFARKGEKVQDINVAAFRAGKAAGQAYRSLLKAGIRSKEARLLVGRLVQGVLHGDAIEPWKTVLTGPLAPAIDELFGSKTLGHVPGTPDVPKALIHAGDAAKDKLSELVFKPS
jgi:indolepyruvate ferredoxin oxidoreductase beta subunit